MVLGFDINTESLKYARAKSKNLKIGNVKFINKDVINDQFFNKIHFDYVIFSMVLHQFSLEEANKILYLIKGSAKYIILADYDIPLPKNIYGLGAKLIEKMAGGQHYINFKDYQKHNGLDYFLNHHQLLLIENQSAGSGILRIVKALAYNE